MYDAHLWSRREGLSKRLDAIANASNEETWVDVGQRYERCGEYWGGRAVSCNV